MRVVVTGSAGFIGRHIVAGCSEHYPDAEIVEVDIATGEDCRDFFREDQAGADIAFHCAALTGGIEGTTNNAAMVGAVNSQLDGAFLEWVATTRPGRSVYFSSSCAYPLYLQGFPRLLKESDIDGGSGDPERTYGWVKLAGEFLAQSVRNIAPISIVRPFAVYGADQDLCHVVPTFVQRALSDAPTFEVWGDGTQTHDFIHVDDVVSALFRIVDLGIDGPINLGTGIGTSVDEVAAFAMKACDAVRPISYRPDKPTGVSYRVGDPTHLLEFYQPRISIEDGIERAVREAR